MRTKALGTNASPAAWALPNGRLRLNIRPPPAAAPACRKPRREVPLDDAVSRNGLGADESMRSRIMVYLPAGTDAVEHFRVDAFRVIGRLHQVRPERSDQNCFAQAFGAVLADVPRDLAGTHGMSHQGDAAKLQGAQQDIEIGREGIVV